MDWSKATKEDFQKVKKIVDRVVDFDPDVDRVDLQMDLIATHISGCPIDFDKMLSAPDFDFFHDIGGIRRHLDRNTGVLDRGFVPRCAA